MNQKKKIDTSPIVAAAAKAAAAPECFATSREAAHLIVYAGAFLSLVNLNAATKAIAMAVAGPEMGASVDAFFLNNGYIGAACSASACFIAWKSWQFFKSLDLRIHRAR